jgi:hypothetical protein
MRPEGTREPRNGLGAAKACKDQLKCGPRISLRKGTRLLARLIGGIFQSVMGRGFSQLSGIAEGCQRFGRAFSYES